MKFIDLFSGIGGFRLGMEMAGHECVGHCEIDEFADKSYRAMHDVKGDEWYGSDIRAIKPGDLPEAECWCGGFPCQSFSVAGKRRGFEDMRGTLIFEVFRLAAERKPEILFLENVAGLLNHDGGRTFGTILCGLWELGYDVQWQVLNSKHFGVPQNRKRVFIIGYLGSGSGRKVLPIRQNGKEVDGIQRQYTNTLTTRYEGGQATGSYIVEGQQHAQEIKQLNQPKHSNPRIRRLTPRECFRLQGFPDEYFDRAAAVNSDSQLYKQAGNLVTVNVIYKIAKRL